MGLDPLLQALKREGLMNQGIYQGNRTSAFCPLNSVNHLNDLGGDTPQSLQTRVQAGQHHDFSFAGPGAGTTPAYWTALPNV